MKDICLVVNTFSQYRDLWPMFFDSLDKHFPDVKRYVFVDEGKYNFDFNSEVLFYDSAQKFKSQFLSCIKQVKEKYCIFISEDYVLYDDVNKDLIQKYKNILDTNENLTFIRFQKGIEYKEPRFKDHSDLFVLCSLFPYFYSQTAALWKTTDLEKIFEQTPESHIAGTNMNEQFEILANQTCQKLDIQGLYCYHGEKKRGIYHYDSFVFPYITTALVKGKWNLSEYREELTPLLEKYNIDVAIRGIY